MSSDHYGSQAGEIADLGFTGAIDVGFGAAWDLEQPDPVKEAGGGKDDLAGWLAWLERTCGTQPCTCRYEWKGLGHLYGSSMGDGWVRMNTEPGCLEHGRAANK